MRYLSKVLFFTTTVFLTSTVALVAQDVSLKIGGCYFINCERTIAFGEQSIMSVSGDDKSGRKVNFDIYSADGVLEASLFDGNFTGIRAADYAIVRFEDGFYIQDSKNQHIVLKIQNVQNTSEKRLDLHVWADLFLPGGNRFQCTPEESNVAMLGMMKGSTFKNNKTAIQL